MKSDKLPPKGTTAQDQQRLVLPVLVTAVVFLLVLAIYSALFILENDFNEKVLFIIGCLGIISAFILYYLILPKTNQLEKLKWVIAIITGVGLGLIAIFIPRDVFSIFYILCLLSVIVIAVINGNDRGPTYLMIGIVTLMSLASLSREYFNWSFLLQALGLPVISVAVSETYIRSSDILSRRIHRMAEINEFARKIASSIESEQVMSLLSAAI